MKVLSIREPFASLIKNKNKYIETRSFKTNYRGELYIHASISKISDNVRKRKELMKIINGMKFEYGYILCRCNLVDCIYMTKEYIEKMRNNNYQEYICGYYEEGRYAWILDDIEILDIPIKVKGQLGIWNYYNEIDIMDMMENIKYGWVDSDGNKYIDDYEEFSSRYILQAPNEVVKSGVGVCWDQVELERYYFKNHYDVKTYFIVYYDGDKCPTHAFLTFKKDNKYYWFEHSWEKFRGIYEYDNIEQLLMDVRDKFIKYEINDELDIFNVHIHEYDKPNYHISVQEFYSHCDNGRYINLEK